MLLRDDQNRPQRLSFLEKVIGREYPGGGVVADHAIGREYPGDVVADHAMGESTPRDASPGSTSNRRARRERNSLMLMSIAISTVYLYWRFL